MLGANDAGKSKQFYDAILGSLGYENGKYDDSRLPTMPADVTGVMPDILLPEPTNDHTGLNEVVTVGRWLENKSF